jgi:hypothetical protein
MRRYQRAIAFAATAASLLVVSAVTLAAGSAAYTAAMSAARSDHRSAVAGCNRMSGGQQRDCLRDADAAREAAMIRARDLQGGAKAMDLNLLPAAEGAAGNEVFEQGTQGGGLPAYRNLPDVQRVPDNLASNARR